MPRDLHDHYFRLAKREGYRSRAAYKLIEIDDRKKLIGRGDCVLDCGAAPGSWLQVAVQRVGPKGVVVGVDLRPIARLPEANVHIVEGDLTVVAPDELLRFLPGGKSRFDTILSDMAPDTTGAHSMDHHRSARLCHAVLDRCGDLLREGGHLAMKVLEGESYPELLARTRTMFRQVKGFRPKASRGESTEIYLMATGFHGVTAHPQREVDVAEHDLPPRNIRRGWQRPT